MSQSQPCTAVLEATSRSGHRSASSLRFWSLVQGSIYINSPSIMNIYILSSFLFLKIRSISRRYLILNDSEVCIVPHQSRQPLLSTMNDLQESPWWEDGSYLLPELPLCLSKDSDMEKEGPLLPQMLDASMEEFQFEKYFDYDMSPIPFPSDFDEIDINDLNGFLSAETEVLNTITGTTDSSVSLASNSSDVQSIGEATRPQVPLPYDSECSTIKQTEKYCDKDTIIACSKEWEILANVFPAKPDVKVHQQRRNRYTRSRRKEVAKNRAVGACIHCKLRKGSVGGIP
jgi:hypothetical protein